MMDFCNVNVTNVNTAAPVTPRKQGKRIHEKAWQVGQVPEKYSENGISANNVAQMLATRTIHRNIFFRLSFSLSDSRVMRSLSGLYKNNSIIIEKEMKAKAAAVLTTTSSSTIE